MRTGHGRVVFQDTGLKEQVAAQQTQCGTFSLTSVATFSTANREADTYHTGRERALKREDDLNQDFRIVWQKIWKREKKTTLFPGRCSY